jgi:hypothetical protein
LAAVPQTFDFLLLGLVRVTKAIVLRCIIAQWQFSQASDSQSHNYGTRLSSRFNLTIMTHCFHHASTSWPNLLRKWC